MKFSSRYDEKSSSYVINWCKIEIIIPGYYLPSTLGWKAKKVLWICQNDFFLFGRFQVHLHQLWAWFSWLQFVMVVWSWLWSSSASSFCVQWHVLGWLDAIKCEMMAVIFVGFLEPPLWFILAWLLGGHAFSFLEYLFSCKSSMMHGEYLVKDHSSCCCCLLLMMLPASYLHSYLGFLKCQNTKWNSPKNPHLFLLGHLNR